jgi:hypothetical protein
LGQGTLSNIEEHKLNRVSFPIASVQVDVQDEFETTSGSVIASEAKQSRLDLGLLRRGVYPEPVEGLLATTRIW